MSVLLIQGRILRHSLVHIKIDFKNLLTEDWFCTALSAQWRGERPGEWPSKTDVVAKMHTVPGMGPTDAPPDQMHTWHLGTGQFVCGAAIVPCHAYH